MIMNRVIEDIITIGFSDVEDNAYQYYPNLHWLYFKFDSVILEFESIEQSSKLRVSVVNDIQYKFEIEEDMLFSNSSIINIILTKSDMGEGNEVKRIDIINMSKNDSVIICDAFKITLVNEQIIFLDPTFIHGISLGGTEQEEYWKENQGTSYKVETLKQN